MESGRDYPNTYREFVKMFPDDTVCAAYLAQLRGLKDLSVRHAFRRLLEQTVVTGPITEDDVT